MKKNHTKKEAISKFMSEFSIHSTFKSKAIVAYLFDRCELSIFNYYYHFISDQKVFELTGRSVNTLKSWKNHKVKIALYDEAKSVAALKMVEMS